VHVSVWYNILQETPKLEKTDIKHFSNWNLFDIIYDYVYAGAFFGGTCVVALGVTEDSVSASAVAPQLKLKT